jgi:hypothetical protein
MFRKLTQCCSKQRGILECLRIALHDSTTKLQIIGLLLEFTWYKNPRETGLTKEHSQNPAHHLIFRPPLCRFF